MGALGRCIPASAVLLGLGLRTSRLAAAAAVAAAAAAAVFLGLGLQRGLAAVPTPPATAISVHAPPAYAARGGRAAPSHQLHMLVLVDGLLWLLKQ